MGHGSLVFSAMKIFAERSIGIISRTLIVLFVVVLVWASRAAAQGTVPTTVQLPTFHYFTSTGSLLVPDGGEAFLGGVGSSAAGGTERGIPGLPSRPFTNSAIGATTGASNVCVSAQIHDFEAMDQVLLGTATSDAVRPPLARREERVAAQRDGNSLQSVAALRAQVAAEDAARDLEAAKALERGRQLLAAGKTGMAKIYFQSALKQSSPTGEVHKQSVTALAGLEQGKNAGTVAGQ
jgi:hypothetical protein